MLDFQSVRTRFELHRARFRVHADRGMAFQDGLAVHAKNDAVVRAGVEVNALGSRREPHAFPANAVVARRSALLVDESKIDSRDSFLDNGVARAAVWIPIAAGESSVRR